jgi:hypothetical protein
MDGVQLYLARCIKGFITPQCPLQWASISCFMNGHLKKLLHKPYAAQPVRYTICSLLLHGNAAGRISIIYSLQVMLQRLLQRR